MMSNALRRLGAVALSAALLPACTATRLSTQAQLPQPLVDQEPVRIGIHYSQEFRDYVHRETRSNIDYEVTLGPAHVSNLDWLLKAMFREVVPVEDPTRVADIEPPLALVLEPKFEEYSFLTPKDVAGDAFLVTIRYLLTLYDGDGGRVDSFTYTGYGREAARTLASKEPLAIATQRAMRDAGAKVAVELTDQESMRILLRHAKDPLPPPPDPQPAATPASVPAETAGPGAGPGPEAGPAAGEPEAPAEPAEPPLSAAGI